MDTLRSTLFTVVLLLALAAAPAAAQTEINVWHLWGPGSTVDEGFHAVAEAFEAQTGIRVNITPAVAPDSIQVAIAAGVPPDVVAAWDSPVVLGWEGWLQPLTSLMTYEGLRAEDFWGPSWNRAYAEGVLWGVPFTSDPNFGLAYNIELFEERGLEARPPETIPELEEYQSRLTIRDEDGNYTQFGFIPWDMYGRGNALMLWLTAFGGGVWDVDTNVPLLTSDGTIQAVEWLGDYAHRWNWRQVRPDPSPFLFSQRYVAMTALGPWDLTYAGVADAGFDFSIGFMPTAPESGVHNPTFLGGHNLVVPVGVTNVDAAMQFIQFALATPEGSYILSAPSLMFPAYRHSDLYAEFEEDPILRGYVRLLETAHASYPVIRPPLGAEVWRLLGEAYDRVLDGTQAARVALTQAQETMFGFMLQAGE